MKRLASLTLALLLVALATWLARGAWTTEGVRAPPVARADATDRREVNQPDNPPTTTNSEESGVSPKRDELQTAPSREPQQSPTRAELQPAASREPLKLPLASPRIVISKSARRLELYSDERVVRTYRVALGGEPVGDKERAGDYRTPEGEFYVCVKNAASKFYLSLGLSYPNREDAARGLRDGLITRRQHDQIARAIDQGLRPPWDTALGGEIFIHGGGTASDWTWGCVALADADIKELFDAVPKGTRVLVEH